MTQGRAQRTFHQLRDLGKAQLAVITKQQHPALRLALPESSQTKKTGTQEKPPLLITIETNGNLRLGPEGKPVTVDRLKEELASAVRKTPDLKVAINADKAAPFGQVIKVMDAAKEAKIKLVNAFTREVKP